MSYTTININYNEGTLCEEISFSEPGEQTYVPGDEIILSDSRLSRIRPMIVMNVNYTEDGEGGLSTTVSGFSTEYKYTRKAPNCDISFFTMTQEEKGDYEKENPTPDSEVFIKNGDKYGVGGWSMHSIVQKIAGWMGLTIINNLPDYYISDFSISLGSTFFEVLNSLVSEFEPLIVLDDVILYILERSGAGALSGGGITPTGFTNRSVDGEYTPMPGCIRVEGGEGKYIAAKDPTIPQVICPNPPCVSYFIGATPGQKTYSGTVKAPDGSQEIYSIIERYIYTPEGDEILNYRSQSSKLTDAAGHSSNTKRVMDYEYDTAVYVLTASTETCEAEISGKLRVYNKISTSYEHDDHWMLIGQVTSRYELFIFDGTNYTAYDSRDYDLDALADGESLELMVSEIRTTRYSEIDKETYGVETVIASKVWNEDDTEWKTSYTFEHDIVEAGSLQRNTRGRGKTLQVYAGDCPVFSGDRYIEAEDPELPGYHDLNVFSEPAKVFNIPTSDWRDIENCYVYLAALVSTEFKKVSASTPIIDPLPLMSIKGLGSIMEQETVGNYYVRGYTINIDASTGYATELGLEARKSAA